MIIAAQCGFLLNGVLVKVDVMEFPDRDCGRCDRRYGTAA